MKIIRTIFAILILAFAACSVAGAADKEEKVVYHMNDASNPMAALNNIRNHLNASPKAKIVVVTHGPGIDFLLDGAKDKNGNPYDAVVQELVNRSSSSESAITRWRRARSTASALSPRRRLCLPASLR